jgi:hypothetical protein
VRFEHRLVADSGGRGLPSLAAGSEHAVGDRSFERLRYGNAGTVLVGAHDRAPPDEVAVGRQHTRGPFRGPGKLGGLVGVESPGAENPLRLLRAGDLDVAVEPEFGEDGRGAPDEVVPVGLRDLAGQVPPQELLERELVEHPDTFVGGEPTRG